MEEATTQNPRQKPRDVQGVVKGTVMRAKQFNLPEGTGLGHAYLLPDTLRLCKQALRVLVGLSQRIGTPTVPDAVTLDLLAVIGVPAHPASGSRIRSRKLAQGRGHSREQGRAVDVVLNDADELRAERR